MLNPVEIALQFKTIPLFERLSTRQLMDLAGVVTEEKHRVGETLCSEGDEWGGMYFIVDGEAAVTKGEKLLAELGPSAFFGEMSLFDNAPRSATVTAKTAIRLLRLERHDLMAIMDEIPAIAIGICQALSSRMREMNVRV